MAGHGIYGPDSIGRFVAGAGSVTLHPSRVTVGGLQYDTGLLSLPVSGLASNSIYYVYLVDVASTPTLVAERRVNSLGPTGYSAWKLVGAFMSSNDGTGVGSAVNIVGEPNAGHISIDNWVCNWDSVLTNKTGTYKFMGDRIELNYRAVFTAAPPLVNLTIDIPTGFNMINGIFPKNGKNFGMMRIIDNSTGTFPSIAQYSNNQQLFFKQLVQAGTGAAQDPVGESTVNGNDFPSLIAGDVIELQAIVPLGDDDNNIQLIDR